MARYSELELLIPRLRRYARGLVGRAALADDLVQDAILSALRSRGMGRGDALLRRLYAIITDFNRLRVADLGGGDDYATDLRGAVIAMRRTMAAGEPGPVPRLPHDPLAGLTLDEREALLLVSVAGLDYDTAAGVAGISPLALMARLASARSRTGENQSAIAPETPVLRATGHRHLRVVS
ncbi:MAG: RNA polymerase sigma factor [Beijerinckiaceae bacterium]